MSSSLRTGTGRTTASASNRLRKIPVSGLPGERSVDTQTDVSTAITLLRPPSSLGEIDPNRRRAQHGLQSIDLLAADRLLQRVDDRLRLGPATGGDPRFLQENLRQIQSRSHRNTVYLYIRKVKTYAYKLQRYQMP